MIVCSCNAIREDEIRTATRRGCRSPESAYASLGCEAQCGTCLCYAQEIIDEELGKVVPIRAKAA
jgi:bacterioferritin-associated ferredoxin